MSEQTKEGMLLGRQVPVADHYSPDLLYPIPRSQGRGSLGLQEPMPFYGVDLWHAYEMSWLGPNGMPVSRVGRISVPASSPNMVESKSLKLYLNSLNHTVYDSSEQARETIENDISRVTGGHVTLELFRPDDRALQGQAPKGDCLDDLSVTIPPGEPDASMLAHRDGAEVAECFYTHLMRSLCPVTGQPDWATVWMSHRGRPWDGKALLTYLLSYRNHQEFHEQCVERIFCDINSQLEPQELRIQAFYTRRGGLDINPYRSTDHRSKPLPRMSRQ
jgi:7-cyano-7-deazaguanine reductase